MSALTVPVLPLPDFAWFAGDTGSRPGAIDPATYGSLAEFAHSRYEVTISPVVREFVILDAPNEDGDTVLATVQYDKTHCTAVGGSLREDGTLRWTCYAD